MRLLFCAATTQELTALAPDCLAPLLDGVAEFSVVAAPEGLFRPEVEAHFCLTGVGPVNAALAMGLALSRLQAQGRMPEAICNTGVAGAYDFAAFPLCTLCIATEELWADYGLHDGTCVTVRDFDWPQWDRPATEGGPVLNRLPLAGPECLGQFPTEHHPFVPCRSATLASISSTSERARLLATSLNAHMENMEGFAVAYAAARLKIPCMEIRSISNSVGPYTWNRDDFDTAIRALDGVLPGLGLLA